MMTMNRFFDESENRTAKKILKKLPAEKIAGWILKIWRILMSRKNMEITGMTRI